ncbi:MAG: flavodoxin-dependent (E)-4-hydroxy-3-methylbut-2-enyl-diphosphate synthase [Ruminococcaceae bacterium]|nr:flavodoxin-dependent (E)-4-hydroxy-3-methylbut-2-enyl-diphosphate synthase [Oscillospiraceae bacterium]
MFARENTSVINVGGIKIGGGNSIAVQSMTNKDTRDVAATVEQIKALEAAGCNIVRVAVLDMDAAEAIKEIVNKIHIPLVADIHFDYRLALKCIESGADKIRLNPGNIGDESRVKAVVTAAKERHIPIRIGINGGSLEKELLVKYGGVAPEAMVESAMGHIEILEKMDFEDIAVSLKASSVKKTVEAYKLMAKKRPYPLHVGVTEAGTVYGGTIKSAAGIGAVLLEGIGDTIRVSLTGDPVEEVRAGFSLLRALELEKNTYSFVSCPTCGRCKVNLIEIATEVEKGLEELNKKGYFTKPISVAVMGCAVNGPGEAKAADIGLAGGDGCALMFESGEIKGKLYGDNIAAQFIEKVKEYYERV